MLIVTDAAAAAFRSAMERGNLSGDGGIRLKPSVPGAGSVVPVVMLANVPTPGDAIVIDHGVRIFLDRQLVPLGDDLVIDATSDEHHHVGFLLRGPA